MQAANLMTSSLAGQDAVPTKKPMNSGMRHVFQRPIFACQRHVRALMLASVRLAVLSRWQRSSAIGGGLQWVCLAIPAGLAYFTSLAKL